MQNKVHHFFDGDAAIVVDVGQTEYGGRHAPVAEDLVETVGIYRVILADEIGNGLQEFNNVYSIFGGIFVAPASRIAASFERECKT